jgi:MFS family permease
VDGAVEKDTKTLARSESTAPNSEDATLLASDSEDAPLSPYAWFVAILLLIVNVHSQWTRALVYYLVSFKAPDNADSARLYMNKDLGFGEEQYAVLASFGFTALFTVFSLIAGRAADKLNRAQVVAAGAAAWSIASIAQATATSFDSILDLRALTGVSQAFLNPQVNLCRCFGLAGLPQGSYVVH